MRKIIYGTSVSLDGFIEDAHGDISWGNPAPDLMQHMLDRERGLDTHLYGRRLYETMTAHWPTADQKTGASDFDRAYAPVWRAQRRVVFSRTLTQVTAGAELFHGDLAAWVAAEKRKPAKDMILGGANLAATFIRLGLVDEYQLFIRPIILGGGKPMFPQLETPLRLDLIETKRFSDGAVMLRLARTGAK